MFEGIRKLAGGEKPSKNRAGFVEQHKKIVKRKKKHTGRRASEGHNAESKFRQTERRWTGHGTSKHERRESHRRNSAQDDQDDREVIAKEKKTPEQEGLAELRETPTSLLMDKIESLRNLQPQDVAEALIEAGNGLFVLMNLKRIFDGGEIYYNRLAQKFIEEGHTKTLATHLDLLPEKKVLDPAIALNLVLDGHKREVKKYPGYFSCSRSELRKMYKKVHSEEWRNDLEEDMRKMNDDYMRDVVGKMKGF